MKKNVKEMRHVKTKKATGKIVQKKREIGIRSSMRKYVDPTQHTIF